MKASDMTSPELRALVRSRALGEPQPEGMPTMHEAREELRARGLPEEDGPRLSTRPMPQPECAPLGAIVWQPLDGPPPLEVLMDLMCVVSHRSSEAWDVTFKDCSRGGGYYRQTWSRLEGGAPRWYRGA